MKPLSDYESYKWFKSKITNVVPFELKSAYKRYRKLVAKMLSVITLIILSSCTATIEPSSYEIVTYGTPYYYGNSIVYYRYGSHYYHRYYTGDFRRYHRPPIGHYRYERHVPPYGHHRRK